MYIRQLPSLICASFHGLVALGQVLVVEDEQPAVLVQGQPPVRSLLISFHFEQHSDPLTGQHRVTFV